MSRTVTFQRNCSVVLAACVTLMACETTHTTANFSTPASGPGAADPSFVSVEPQPVAVEPAPAPTPVKRVVRSALVPDEDEIAAARPTAQPEATQVARAERASVAPREKPVRTPAAKIVETPPPVTPPAATDVAADPDELASPVTAPVPKPEPAAKPAISAEAAKPSPSETAAPATVKAEPASEPAAEAAAPPTSITPDPKPDLPAASTAADAPPPSVFNDPSVLLSDPKSVLQAKIGGMPLWLVVTFAVLGFISLVIGFTGRKAPVPVEPARPREDHEALVPST
jgi:hypothetical protein